jgi:hypothetical protein
LLLTSFLLKQTAFDQFSKKMAYLSNNGPGTLLLLVVLFSSSQAVDTFVATTADAPTVEVYILGNNGEPEDVYPLPECAGDCDDDKDVSKDAALCSYSYRRISFLSNLMPLLFFSVDQVWPAFNETTVCLYQDALVGKTIIPVLTIV